MRGVKVIAAVLASVAIAGCGSTRSAKSSAQPPPLGAVPIITSPDAISLPIDAYTPTQSEEDTLGHAAAISFARCMQRFGFREPKKLLSDTQPALVLHNLRARSPIYGFFDPSVVHAEGYGVVRSAGGRAATREAEVQPPTTAEKSLITGHDASGARLAGYDGKPVPKEGCQGYAFRAVGGSLPGVGSTHDMPGGGPDVPLTDPRIASVNKQWSDCMEVKGFDYPTPVDAISDPKWKPDPKKIEDYRPSREQIAVASADMGCKLSLNLVGIDVAVASAYHKQYIDSHAAELAEYRRDFGSRLKKAAAIIASENAI
ncbi:hypothetical protein [Streptomyces sp. BK340]|uniref:hypothetical protein n=1 Tax=Streptomyces sp. BK340 TaxID=2572903 RepID=UPI0011A768BD|nr:hypothetical protein [Streptomyces sp. BK340]